MEAWILEHPVLTFILGLCFIFGFKPVHVVITNAAANKDRDE